MAGYFPEDLIEEIRSSNDIVEVVSEYVNPLVKKGKYHFGRCPFHNEKTASFTVDSAKQIFHCFGCGKGGNVFNFIMAVENMDFPETLKLLAERAKITLPDTDGSSIDDSKSKLKKELLNINVEAAKFFHTRLISGNNREPAEYFKKRRIDRQTLIKFGLGYSGEKYDELFTYLLSMGYDKSVVLQSGLVIAKENGKVYDRFRGRVMFPIFDVRGNVIAFGGRVMDSSQPKYMNSPETEVYSKGKHLYALNFAKNTCAKQLILVEGYMDVIALHQSGITNAVAPLGTALTENQGRLLKKYTEEIIISFDSDTAGQAATGRSLDILNDIGCNISVLNIPTGKDPDEFIKSHGVEEFKKLINKSKGLLDFKFDQLDKSIDISTSTGKINYIEKAEDILDKIDNNVERELFVKKIAKKLDVSEQSIYSDLAKKHQVLEKQVVRQTKTVKNRSSNIKTPDNQQDKLVEMELMLLATICLENNVYLQLKEEIIPEIFSIQEIRGAAVFAIDRINSKIGINAAEIMNKMPEALNNKFVSIVQTKISFEDNKKAILDILKGIKLNKLEARKIEINESLSRSELNEGDVELLNQELLKITANIISLKNKK